jgi:uncharacterized CHY-type Zn-finger protein
MHVFKDLQPYICTFEGCHDMLVTFPTRKLWSDHEFSVHRQRQSFTCYQCYQELETDEIFRQHLDDAHSMQLNHKQFVTAVSAARVTAQKPVINEQCPLCLKCGWASVRAFTTHVGRHMEGIALASLPKNDETDSEADESQSTHSLPRTTESGLSDVISRPVFASGQTPSMSSSLELPSYTHRIQELPRNEVFSGFESSAFAFVTPLPGSHGSEDHRDFQPEGNHVSEIQPRSHPLYQKSKDPDGFYRCPFQEESKCNHEPTAQKCGYE